MISIEFSVVSGKHLDELLNSLRKQKYQDFEVIIVNSNPEFSGIIREFGAKEIFKKTGKLEARALAHKEAKGDFELLLEETRLLTENALYLLHKLDNIDMAIIHELELGNHLVNKLNRFDSENAFRFASVGPGKLYLLPRYFRHEVLSNSFASLYNKIPTCKISKIVANDLEMIYIESFQQFNKVTKVEEPLIIKYGEKSFRESFKKYYRYGKTSRELSKVEYYKMLNYQHRIRPIPNLKSVPPLLLLYAIRGTAFLSGYYLNI
jgi:glycosyltransferase involved in cell wall biosynthesis